MSDDLLSLLDGLDPEELAAVLDGLPHGAAEAMLAALGQDSMALPRSPIEQARLTDPGYRARPHLLHVSEALADAVQAVEAGHSRRLIIEMPPRTGKTTLVTQHAVAWMLARHPEWSVVLTSHDASLATSWGRQIRRWVEAGQVGSAKVAPDAGAVSEWQTTDGGSVVSRSVRASLTGRGAKVLIVDDPVKDYVEAHSEEAREATWNWWLSVAQTRLEPPYLVVVIATRWHQDDLIGRILSPDYEGEPSDWREIRLPALAEGAGDALGRSEGEPLLSPLIDEDEEQALARWASTRRDVGTYSFTSMYQQRPAPPSGSIFDMEWIRYWTSDPARAEADDTGKTRYFDPSSPSATGGGRWVESWDCAFKGKESSDYVVGQRWVLHGPDRYLVAQRRDRMTFTATVAAIKSFHAPHVHEVLVEDKANGPAVIDTLRMQIAGIIAIDPKTGKEARARAITPELESGNVYLPHPSEPGCEWVRELLSELRAFPHDAHDDQVDALTQALARLRPRGSGGLVVPSRVGRTIERGIRGSGSSQLSRGPSARR